MTQPTPYARIFDFSGWQAAFPDLPLPGNQVDAELNAIKASLNLALKNLALIQRDDTMLANDSVNIEQLGDAVIALIGSSGFRVRGAWATNTVYAPGDMFLSGGSVYLAMLTHTSGITLVGDVTAGKVAGPVFSPTMVFPPFASAPSNPSAGQTYFDTTLGYPLIWTGTAWLAFRLS